MNTISLENAGNLTTDDFFTICQKMFNGVKDQKSVAGGLGISQQSVSNFKNGVSISARSGRKIITSWNSFCETGEAPKPVGLIDGSDDDTGMRPFVAVPMARDRVNGRLYPADKIGSGLLGNTSGPVQSDDEVVARIGGRFNVMVQIIRRMLRKDENGNLKVRSAIVQAASGVGKTHTIIKELMAHQAKLAAENLTFFFKVLSGGGVTASSLYKTLYAARKGGVVVLDDNDSILDSDEGLNMVKCALDTSQKRTLTWTKRSNDVFCPIAMTAKAERESGKEYAKDPDTARSSEQVYEDLTFGLIPNTFEFKGGMIFITNLDFKGIAMSGSARAAHVMAMMDRSFFINLTISTSRDRLLWSTHVFTNHMADNLSDEQVADIVKFVKDNSTKFFSMSLRLFGAIADLASDPESGDWKEVIIATKFK
jgi:hypothetical protein